ncbi:MAG: translational GTPase TypA [Bifidobacteriaceae bacterium]|jgi:GTP-binding protein|nr:translational GTPase TypA [Bifidobacteriaceae bacterium]
MADRVSRPDLRNVAIVAHVDHGKTTLVDAMLWQTGAFGTHEHVAERALDSGDLEREKGITILAKNTAVHYRGSAAGPALSDAADPALAGQAASRQEDTAGGREGGGGAGNGGSASGAGVDAGGRAAGAAGAASGITINVVDTPGHADFGGEVERGLSMVDGVVLLVDASEGPLPQTRFVLRKALAAELPVILVVNKVDRPDARIAEVVAETTDLLLSLAGDLTEDDPSLELDHVLDFPIIYASAKAGRASLTAPADGQMPAGPDLEPLFRAIIETIPAPTYDPAAPLQAHVTNLDASPFLGRLALLRIHSGELRKGQTVAWVSQDGAAKNVKITELLATEALDRVSTERASAGDIVAVAGIADIMIGDTLTDPDDPRPLPTIKVDDPAISMTIGVNTSPLAGKVKGHKLTARQVKDRLDRELVGNVSLRVLATGRPDVWEVRGRGELALAVLVEQMRREGFELTVGKPQVVTRTVDGQVLEPMERMTIDAPEEHLGAITQLMAARKGRLTTMANHGSGWVRMEFVVPARGLISFRTQFLTETRGTGIASSLAEGYEPWAGPIELRTTGSMVADRPGLATSYALTALQERGSFFVGPGEQVYEGMVVGENPRGEDMDVNITREKKLTNMRASTGDELERLTPPRRLTLEESLEFAAPDECVEVTPDITRIRKVELSAELRGKARGRAKRESGG